MNPFNDYHSEVFKAWVGAWIDTEGCIYIKKRKWRKVSYNTKNGKEQCQVTRGHQLCVVISQVNPTPLLIIQEAYGGSLMKRHPSNSKWKQAWVLELSSRKAINLIKDVHQYIIVKKGQANVAIEFYIGIDSMIANNGHNFRGNKVTQKETQKRELLKHKIHKLNQGNSSTPKVWEKESEVIKQRLADLGYI